MACNYRAEAARWPQCVQRLRRLGGDALRGKRSKSAAASCLDFSLVAKVAEDLQYFWPQIDAGAYESAWSAVGYDNVVGLVSLHGLLLRLSSASSSATPSKRAASAALRAALTSHLQLLNIDVSLGHAAPTKACTVANALINSHCLLCYSRLLAEVAASGLTMEGGPAVGPSTTDATTARNASLALLSEVCDLLEFLLGPEVFGFADADSALFGLGGRGGLLEHWARVILLVMSQPPPPQQQQDPQQLQHQGPSRGLDAGQREKVIKLFWRIGPLLDAKRLAIRMAGPAASPCLAYLLSMHAVQLAAVLDGGTTYGMPTAIAVPVYSALGQLVPADSSGQPKVLDSLMAQSALSVWREQLVQLLWTLRDPSRPYLARTIDTACVQGTSLREVLESCVLPMLQRELAKLDAMNLWDGGRDLCTELFAATRSIIAATTAEVEEVLEAPAIVPPYNVVAVYDVAMRLAQLAARAMVQRDGTLTTPAAMGAQLVQQMRSRRAGNGAAGRDGAGPAAAAAAELPQQHQEAQGDQPQQHQEAQGDQPQQGEEGRPEPPLRLPLAQACGLAVQALRCARQAMWNIGWAPCARTSPEGLSRLRAWWGCAAEVVSRGVDAMGHAYGWRLADMFPLLPLRAGLARPDPHSVVAPSGDVAAALSSCEYVRLVELVLRKAGDKQDALVALLFGGEPDRPRYSPSDDAAAAAAATAWRQALAMAPPVHVAALLTTLAKVARRVGPDLAAAAAMVRSASTASDHATSLLGLHRLGLSADVLGRSSVVAMAEEGRKSTQRRAEMALQAAMAAAAPPPPPAALAVTRMLGGGAATAAAEGPELTAAQLARHTSYAAVRLLPDACKLAACLLADSRMLNEEGNFSWSALHRFTGFALRWALTLQRAAAAAGNSSGGDTNPAEPAAVAAEWEALLWGDLDLVGLAVQIERRLLDNGLPQRLATSTCVREAWTETMAGLLRMAPDRLATALTRAGAEGSDGELRSQGAKMRAWSRVRRILGPADVDLPPEVLQKLERICTAAADCTAAAVARRGAAASQLAVASDSVVDATPAAAAAAPPPEPDQGALMLRFAALFVSPDAARSAVAVCCNPLCTQLEGDSEAEVRLLGCKGCGGRVRYCCKACQTAHWKARHKVECGGQGGGAVAAAAGAAAAAAAAAGGGGSTPH